jgi:hypothetical protein
MQEIDAALVLTREDIAYLWNGGLLAVKIDTPETRVSIDVSSASGADNRRQRVKIKRIEPKRSTT